MTQIVDSFNAAEFSLSKKAALSPGQVNGEDTAWTIHDGLLSHVVRYQPCMGAELAVYLTRSPAGLTDLPNGIYVSLTMRRALRVKANEGRVLEDTGIVPDIAYRMTFRDVMEQNQDLFERAGVELGGSRCNQPPSMPRWQLPRHCSLNMNSGPNEEIPLLRYYSIIIDCLVVL